VQPVAGAAVHLLDQQHIGSPVQQACHGLAPAAVIAGLRQAPAFLEHEHIEPWDLGHEFGQQVDTLAVFEIERRYREFVRRHLDPARLTALGRAARLSGASLAGISASGVFPGRVASPAVGIALCSGFALATGSVLVSRDSLMAGFFLIRRGFCHRDIRHAA
jgi:hypothetical protein